MADSCQTVAEGDGKQILIALNSNILASCANYSGDLEKIPLKEWPMTWIGFMTAKGWFNYNVISLNFSVIGNPTDPCGSIMYPSWIH